jgi:hypothetical protein
MVKAEREKSHSLAVVSNSGKEFEEYDEFRSECGIGLKVWLSIQKNEFYPAV